MAAELRILQEQNQQLSLALQKTLAQLEEAVKSINARLDASDAATRKALADQKLIIDNSSTELRVIRERAQDSSTRIGTLTEEVEALRRSLTTLTTTLAVQQQTRTVDPDTGLPIEQPQPVAPPAVASLGVSPSRLYQTAWGEYTSGQYTLAISGFEHFLREFPTSELADDAQLHVGKSYMAQKKFQDAAAALSALIRNYPSGDKVPEAYLELGQAQRQMGQTDLARRSWEMIVNNYKDSSSAIIARQRLDGLPPAP